MGIDRPDAHTLVFQCEACDDTMEFVAGEPLRAAVDFHSDKLVSDPPNFIVCCGVLDKEGWTSQKRPGSDWQYYCPRCGEAAKRDKEAAAKRAREIERRRSAGDGA